MAVIPQISICQSSNCKGLTFVETTGAYNATYNLNGWGAPNRTTAMATAAVLTVTNPAGTAYNIDLFATGNFPTTNDSLEYEIDVTDIGLTEGDEIPDGIYKFKYTVTTVSGTTVVYSTTIYHAFYCQVQCCIHSMFKDIDVECDCSATQIEQATKGLVLLKGLTSAANCGNVTEFNTILAQLEKICLNVDCSTCE